MDNGRLVYKGLTDPVNDAVGDSFMLEKKEAEISRALVVAMADSCAVRGVPFLLVHLPDGRTAALDTLLKPLVDISRFLDLQPFIDMNSVALPMDGHPNPAGHRLVAGYLLSFLEKHLAQAPNMPPPYGVSNSGVHR